HDHDNDRSPARRAEPTPPRRHHTVHVRKTKHAGRFRRPPPVGGRATPPGVRRARLIPRRYRQVPSVAGRPAGGRGGTLEQQLAERPPAPRIEEPGGTIPPPPRLLLPPKGPPAPLLVVVGAPGGDDLPRRHHPHT